MCNVGDKSALIERRVCVREQLAVKPLLSNHILGEAPLKVTVCDWNTRQGGISHAHVFARAVTKSSACRDGM